jgi:membrane-associated phospholipid phosphatase
MRGSVGSPRISSVLAFAGATLTAVVSPGLAHADAPAAPSAPAARIVVDRRASLAWSATLAGAWVTSEVLKGELAPGTCRVCASNAFDDAVRTSLRGSDTDAAATASDVFGFGVAPLVGVGALYATRTEDQEFLDDLLIVAEATAGAGALVQGTKFLVARQRPFVHALAPNEPGPARDTADDNLSFYSGHTSVTVALGTSVAMLATLRGHRASPWLWASGLGLGLLTGALRIVADRHYASDVLTGAAVGAGLGVAIPWLHVTNEASPAAWPALAVGTGACTLTWAL